MKTRRLPVPARLHANHQHPTSPVSSQHRVDHGAGDTQIVRRLDQGCQSRALQMPRHVRVGLEISQQRAARLKCRPAGVLDDTARMAGVPNMLRKMAESNTLDAIG